MKKFKDKSIEEKSADRINYLITKGIVTESQISADHKSKIKKVK